MRILLAALLALFVLVAVDSHAGRADSKSDSADPSLSDEQKSVAMAFAKEHHPQLASLFTRLARRDPSGHEKALLEVSRAAERLQRMRSRDQERYEVDLSLWKTDSRVRLLAARMAKDQRSSLESQLKSLLDERYQLRLRQLELERKRIATRLDRVNAQIEELRGDREALVNREFERLQNSVRSRTSAVSKKQKSIPDSGAAAPAKSARQPARRKIPADKTAPPDA